MLGYYECIKLGSISGIVLGTILGYADGITLGLDVGTELDYLDGSFDGSNRGNIQGLFLKVHCDLLMVKCLNLMMASNWDLLMVM